MSRAANLKLSNGDKAIRKNLKEKGFGNSDPYQEIPENIMEAILRKIADFQHVMEARKSKERVAYEEALNKLNPEERYFFRLPKPLWAGHLFFIAG